MQVGKTCGSSRWSGKGKFVNTDHVGHGKISCLENFIYMCRCGYVLGRNAVGKIHGEMAFGKCGWGNTIGEMLLSKTLLGIAIVTLLEIGRVQNNKIIDPTGVPP